MFYEASETILLFVVIIEYRFAFQQRVFCIYYLNLFWMCSWNKMVTCKATYSMLQYRIFYIQVLDTENFISRILCKQRSLSCQTYLIVYHHFIVKEKFFDILTKSHPSIINLDLCTINIKYRVYFKEYNCIPTVVELMGSIMISIQTKLNANKP